VLSPGNGKTRTGRLWTDVRDDRRPSIDTPPAVWFAYSEDRKGEHPRQHLSIFQRALQADAYAGFQHLYGKGISEAACLAHARRKFHEIQVVHASPTPTEALARISALYGIEEEVRGKPADLRLTSAGHGPTVARRTSCLDADGTGQTIVKERDCGRDPLCALPLACAHALCR
jgi:transposase